jgi:hypothetical protein
MVPDFFDRRSTLTGDGLSRSEGRMTCNPRRDNVPEDNEDIWRAFVNRFAPIPRGFVRTRLSYTSEAYTGKWTIEWRDEQLPQNISVT